MLYFPQPEKAVVSALELADAVPAADLPPAHTGIDAGPVIFQDGDYFGRTVNAAARIAAYAGPGEVLVSDSVVGVTKNPSIRFVDLGLVLLKGLTRPISLHRAGSVASERTS
jgi:class 3 adenylate cyclase